jgi:hypothetical protein
MVPGFNDCRSFAGRAVLRVCDSCVSDLSYALNGLPIWRRVQIKYCPKHIFNTCQQIPPVQPSDAKFICIDTYLLWDRRIDGWVVLRCLLTVVWHRPLALAELLAAMPSVFLLIRCCAQRTWLIRRPFRRILKRYDCFSGLS